MTQGPSQGGPRVYGLVTTVFLVLTALTLCGVIGFAVLGPKSGVASQPTAFAGFPTSTPTLGGPTQPSTFTPAPFPTATATRPATRTPAPSGTPTPTNTSTATNTMTPSNTPLATNTPRPTNTPVRQAFDYTLQNGVATYKKNSKFSGCDAVIAGIVKDINGNQGTQLGMKVQVTGNEATGTGNSLVITGDNTEYGQSGWEYYYNNHAVQRTYGVRLQYSDGVTASDIWQITTNAACNKNEAFLTFVQIQARQ